MTTPERLRRRQRIEGAILVLIGIGLVLQNRYFADQNAEQNKCVADKFAALTRTLNLRGDLASEISNNTETVILSVAAAKTKADVEGALTQYRLAVAKTREERKDHPYPPFPNGTCQ